MLNEMGLECSGSDLSESMLTKARQNLEGLNIPLQKSDFRNLQKEWSQTFDMIICMSTSFPHNANKQEAVQTLHSIYACLNKGGIVVIDNGFSDVFFDHKPRFVPARLHKDQAFYFFLEYPDPTKVIFNILHIRKTEDGFDHKLETIDYMAIRKKDFEKFFKKTSFIKVEYFGSFDFDPYDVTTSQRTIVIALKQ
jgi:ubiquinone/menaquinone biosynthesis C-methylase UbiE